MEQQEQAKPKKRRIKQLYFGKRDTRLWEWVQSMPDGDGNAAICSILNYYLYGGVKPDIPSYLDGVDAQEPARTTQNIGQKQKQQEQDIVFAGLDSGLIK